MACTPSAVAMCVLPVPGPPTRTTLFDGLNKVTTVQLPDQGFVDLAAGKIEASQIAIDREAGDLELVGHGADLPLGGLRLEQLGWRSRRPGRPVVPVHQRPAPCRASSGCAA